MAIHVVRGMVAGMLAGCAASWAMNQFQGLRPQNQPHKGDEDGGGEAREKASMQEHHESEEDNATVKTAQMVSRKVFQHELSEPEKQVAGPAVHYAYGTLIGGLYGGLAELLPGVASGVGLPFGAALWLLGDEIAVPALGLSKGPTEFEPDVHADALAAHFMYGATLDLMRRVLRHVV
jgi:putative membrane protein